MDSSRKIFALLVIVVTVFVLIYGQSIILPLVMAGIAWVFLREVKNMFRRIPFIRDHFPSWLLSTITTLVLIAVAFGAVMLLTTNIQGLSEKLEGYESNINNITAQINQTFGIDLEQTMKDLSGSFEFTGILSTLLSTLSSVFGNTFTILLYLLFLLLEEAVFSDRKSVV